MDILCFILALLALFIGVPVSFIWLIVALCIKRDKKTPLTMLIGCFAGAMVLMIVSLSFTSDEESETANSNDAVIESEDEKENKEEEEEMLISYDDMELRFIEYKIEENMSGEKCLVLYFDFTNNADDNTAFAYEFDTTAFQDGVELDFSLWHVNEESKNGDKEIQPGTTIRVAESFVLTESMSNVEVEIEPFSIWSDRKLLEFEVKLEE